VGTTTKIAAVSDERQIEPGRAAELIEGGAALIDVRDPEEYEAGHIAGARHVPLEQLSAETAGGEPSGPVVFYCRSGDRSTSAAEAFAASGWDAHNIAGGLEAWAAEGLPLEPEDGKVAERSGLPPA
jgi:rhodanese-related sulfurtransferase